MCMCNICVLIRVLICVLGVLCVLSVVIGEMEEGPDKGKRFIANMALTDANLRLAYVDDLIGRVGLVTKVRPRCATPRICVT